MIKSNDFWVELKRTTSEKGTTSLQRTRVVLPTCPLFRGSTVINNDIRCNKLNGSGVREARGRVQFSANGMGNTLVKLGLSQNTS